MLVSLPLPVTTDDDYLSQRLACLEHSRAHLLPSICGGVACQPAPTPIQLTKAQSKKTMARRALRLPLQRPSCDV